MKSIEMHIHSFSLRFQFKYRSDFDVFAYIALARERDHRLPIERKAEA